MRRLPRILSAAVRMLSPKPRRRAAEQGSGADPGRTGATVTTAISPARSHRVVLAYSPDPDGDPDAGEIVWTWVPYEENDGRGKDRPVLVIGLQSADRVYALRLTSSAHDGDGDYVALGAGGWDASGRPSWVDLGRLYSVHAGGMRREAAILDVERFMRVADALHQRYGWRGEK